jgi:transcriptional regulator with XRE-family HTH domain
MKNLAGNLRATRERAGYTRRVLADRAGVSERSIAAYESGETMPRADALHRITEALGCSLDDLAGEGVPA